MSESEVLKLLERRISEAGSAMALARQWGISCAYLSDVRRRKRYLTHKILAPLGLVVFTEYRKMK